MPHIGLGKLLEDFGIGEAPDYYLLPPGKQSTFVSRLYSELVDHARHGIDRLKTDAVLKTNEGLKLHFMVEPDEAEGFRNLPDDVFFRKVCFYATRTVVTFPFRESGRTPRSTVRHGNAVEIRRDKEVLSFGKYRAERDGYGGRVEEVGKNHHLYRSEFDAFLHLLCSAKPFLDEGFLTVVPSYYPEARKLRIGSKSQLGLVPANFKRAELRHQFEEEGLEEYDLRPGSTPAFYLPYFTNLSSDEVLSIRREETRPYQLFQRHLSHLLTGLPRLKTEEALFQHLGEIHDGVLALQESYEMIEKAARNRNIQYLVGIFGLCLVPFVPVALAPTLSALLGAGGVSFVDYLAKRAEAGQQRHKLKLENPEIYLMWRLVDMDKRHSHRKAG